MNVEISLPWQELHDGQYIFDGIAYINDGFNFTGRWKIVDTNKELNQLFLEIKYSRYKLVKVDKEVRCFFTPWKKKISEDYEIKKIVVIEFRHEGEFYWRFDGETQECGKGGN